MLGRRASGRSPTLYAWPFRLTGTGWAADGFVEVWDSARGKHRMDLDYQTREELMLHDAGGSCARLSPILSFCVRVAQGRRRQCGARVLGGYWSHSQERTK